MVFRSAEFATAWPSCLVLLLGSLVSLMTMLVGDGRAVQVGEPSDDRMQAINPRIAAPFEIDLERVAAHGIRVLESEHLILFTDVRPRSDIEALTEVFDLAVVQWCVYFDVDRTRSQHWKMRAYVIENKARFQQAGLMPDTLPPFPAGFQFGRDMWVYVQPGEYYTRHLLLHEGCHAFMEWFLDGSGSPWYSEGMAEKLGLHQWTPAPEGSEAAGPGQLKLDFWVTQKSQVPYWGRINLIRKDLDQNQRLGLQQVLSLPASAFRDVRHYGWAWAGCEFLSQHPLSQSEFKQWVQQVSRGQALFDRSVSRSLGPHLPELEREWALYIDELDYGMEVAKIRLKDASLVISADSKNRYRVDASSAWQLTPVQLKTGDRLRIRCNSTFEVGRSLAGSQPRPWISAADGITLEYYRGRPLGVLLAGSLNDDSDQPAEQVAGLLKPVAVGSDGEFVAIAPGRLCLRINESPAKMLDNQGALEVEIDQVK